jgi:hypothetical protein
MKAYLMFPDRDFDPDQHFTYLGQPPYARRGIEFDPWKPLPWNAKAIAQDLELDTLFAAMADGDEFLFEVSRNAVLSSATQMPATILYRHEVLKDCLAAPAVIRDIYKLAVDAVEGERKKVGWWSRDYPSGVLSHAVEVLQFFVTKLRQLRAIVDEHGEKFSSRGLSRLSAMLKAELSDTYFAEISAHLRELQFRDGVLVSARLGRGNKAVDYVLRQPAADDRGWLNRLFSPHPPSFTLYLAPRDEAGAKHMSDLRDRGVSLVANALAKSTDHILSFFRMLKAEVAFYAACLNLHDHLDTLGEPVCFSHPRDLGDRAFCCRELYDVCLALSTKRKVVGNDVDANRRDLVVVTGANQGGKSTFLRSVGLAQIMMQAGMFVGAREHECDVADGISTHYKREEDTSMTSGKLDEELARMSEIVGHLRINGLVLFNESFAATNEREGSEIARQIVSALIKKRVKVFFVTHLFELASGFYQEDQPIYFFLRAERDAAGQRSFKLRAGEPLRTSFGEDLYRRIFETAA